MKLSTYSLTLTALTATAGLTIATSILQKTYSINASKDSSILRASVSCPNCPNNNCYECKFGTRATLIISSDGPGRTVDYSALIGFTLPSETINNPDRLDKCELLLPASYNNLFSPQTLRISSADPGWDEESVNGNNAPAVGSQIGQVVIPASQATPDAVDLTEACKIAAGKGSTGFSIYLTKDSANLVEIPSKDIGKPAVLRTTIY
ncbi:hypothetical protein H4219_005916 [Mycoemilia scoparia]|uniref:Carbohydrate-binding module family 96 domain-containing protein n=1 Tax=Mycoemilia scoparia TaxID=417184 RepID=A0A9W8DN95_9FUNG|nr:hypothetical protein H4219_005916 [Mycoemilia scoparia]